MNRFLEALKTGQVLIADGATGTNLQAVGLEAGMHTEDWVFDYPDRILGLARAFIEAGSDIILSCTFGGTAIRMRGAKYGDQAPEVNRQAVQIAKEAVNGRSVLVAGSMGPLGQLLKPYGPISQDEATAAYGEQAQALAAGGADLLLIETQFSMDEAQAALRGARAVTDLPLVVSFSYDRGTRSMMGVKPGEVASTFQALGAAMVGVNCGTTLENALAVVKAYEEASPGFPLWVKPNAGLPRMEGTDSIYDVTPGQLAEFAAAAVKLGARVVGGCCGSTPAHVAAIASAVKSKAAL